MMQDFLCDSGRQPGTQRVSWDPDDELDDLLAGSGLTGSAAESSSAKSISIQKDGASSRLHLRLGISSIALGQARMRKVNFKNKRSVSRASFCGGLAVPHGCLKHVAADATTPATSEISAAGCWHPPSLCSARRETGTSPLWPGAGRAKTSTSRWKHKKPLA